MAQSREVNLKTVEWGVANASLTALLVHGLTGRAEAFETLVEGLAPTSGVSGGPWRLLAPDLRGRGDSKEVPEVEAGVPGHARDLLTIMDREELEKVVLVGHSMGAMIGVYLAAHYPERFGGLILIDGGSEITDEIDALLNPVHRRLEGTYPSREAYLEYLKRQPIFEGRWDENLERYFAGDVHPGSDGRWYPVTNLEAVRKDRENMHGLPLSELWPLIRCPTLILLSTVGLAGPQEGFILPPDDARRMAESIADCTLVEVENKNHYDILYSAPPIVVDAVRAFLSRLSN